jgi:hypothetical protein
MKALAAPFTVNTMPERTLEAFGDHGEVGQLLALDDGDCERVLTHFTEAGLDVDALARRLQNEGATSFVKSWNDLLACVESKTVAKRAKHGGHIPSAQAHARAHEQGLHTHATFAHRSRLGLVGKARSRPEECPLEGAVRRR